MAYLGLMMFLTGLWGLKSEYFGDKWIGKRKPVDGPKDEIESRLHYGIIKSWGGVLIGLMCMLIFPWSCNGL